MSIKKLTEELSKLMENFEDIEFEELKAEVSELTDVNNHTEAMMLIADKYDMPQLEGFKKIKKIQDREYGLDIGLAAERHELYKEMFNQLADKIGKEKAQELRSCT